MLESGIWDFPGLTATPFNSHRVWPAPTSVYGSTKLAQEHILSSWCLAMNVTPVLFRLQNVYGPGQSLINPYTGIVSLFAQKAKAGEVIPVYEDGEIIRDFVFIDDVADAIVAGTLQSPARPCTPTTSARARRPASCDWRRITAAHYGAPEPAGQRHVPGRRRAARVVHHRGVDGALGWAPKVMVEEGLQRLCTWVDQART